MSVRCVHEESNRSFCGETVYDTGTQNCCGGAVYNTETQYCVEHGPSEKTIVDKKDVVVEGRVNCTFVYFDGTQITLSGNWCTVVTNGEEWYGHLCYVNSEVYRCDGCDIKFPTENYSSALSCNPAQ